VRPDEEARKLQRLDGLSHSRAADARTLCDGGIGGEASLPTEGYPAGEVLMVYRLRWQIELAFKRLKSLLRMDRIPTQTERASRSWLTAHLILALLCDDLGQEVLASSP